MPTISRPAPQTLKFVASHSLAIGPASSQRGITSPPAASKNTSGVPIEPSALRVGPDGMLYVADPENSRILVLNKSYAVTRTIGGANEEAGGLSLPIDFSFSRDGKSIFVVDHYNYRIVKYSIDGQVQGHSLMPFGQTTLCC
jgi:sugar lactone lactonase YvrE